MKTFIKKISLGLLSGILILSMSFSMVGCKQDPNAPIASAVS